MKLVVVGGGMQGRVIAKNLLSRKEQPEVVVVDVRETTGLPAGIKFQKADVLDIAQAKSVATGADAVVLAVPSEISHKALSNLIGCGVPVADVSFTPNPPLDLHPQAVKSGACCVVDCGVAPGLSHILAGSAHAEFGGLDSLRILVGGMPQTPPAVFRHAVYFNPHDLLSEYIRPARARKAGKDIAPPPLDVPEETYTDSELGDLKAFLSDGLRSLLTSYPDVADMAELTLRWTGHLEAMKSLREMGILDDAKAVSAVASALGNKYPADSYPDVLLMVVEAKRGNKQRSWRMIDRRTRDESAMSRTTGFTTAAMAMALATKQFTEPGVHPPEHLGRDPKVTAFVIEDLAARGVSVQELLLTR